MLCVKTRKKTVAVFSARRDLFPRSCWSYKYYIRENIESTVFPHLYYYKRGLFRGQRRAAADGRNAGLGEKGSFPARH